MKKRFLPLAAGLLCLSLAACAAPNGDGSETPAGTDASYTEAPAHTDAETDAQTEYRVPLVGVVKEVYDNGMLIEGGFPHDASASLYTVTRTPEGAEDVVPVEVGDTVTVLCDGTVMESYPMQLHKVYAITVTPQGEATTAPETEPETTSPEDIVQMEDQAYLDSLDYRKFVLTDEETPHYVGRWFEKSVEGASHMVTTTDGAHLYFLVEGTAEIAVNFTVITKLELPYFAYSIDGGEPVRQHIDEATVTLPDDGRHTVCIIADGLSETEQKWARETGFALRSVEAGEGRIVGIRPDEKIVFFYGDSITEGIRALSMEANANGNSATHAYSWYTAQNLGATPYLIGYGATGLIQTGSFNTMLNAIDSLSRNRLVEDSPVANVTPDLIVINHGANDSGLPVADFDAALRTAVARLQEKYPGVPIIYCVAFLEAENATVQAQGAAIDRLATEIDGLYVVHTGAWALSYTDGNLHPDAAGGKKAGDLLAEAILEIVGEDFFK